MGTSFSIMMPAQSEILRVSPDCYAAIQTVEKDLAERNYFIPWYAEAVGVIQPSVSLDAEYVQKYYYDYPVDRTEKLVFHLSGDANRLYLGIMSSPQFMANRGAQIMEKCPTIGMVSFQHWWEGDVPVGYFPDGSVKAFEWVDLFASPHQREDGTFEWGYYFSP
jgi:hypothetical protein